MTLPDALFFDDQQYQKTPPIWVHKEDVASGVFLNDEGRPALRSCATAGGCPAVFVLRSPLLKVVLDKNWQFAIAAWNYGMDPEDVSTEFDYRLAFCNNTGLRNPNIPRRDYLKGLNLTAPEEPKFDKDRTCSRSKLSGTVVYNLSLALSETFQALRETVQGIQAFATLRKHFLAMLTTNNALRLLTMDGSNPPRLKPGKSHPQRVQDISPDDYLYSPRTHPWLFFAANTVGTAPGGGSKVMPFPRGVSYPWMGDGWKYTWMPHVARGTINYALSKLTKLQPGAPFPSAYRS